MCIWWSWQFSTHFNGSYRNPRGWWIIIISMWDFLTCIWGYINIPLLLVCKRSRWKDFTNVKLFFLYHKTNKYRHTILYPGQNVWKAHRLTFVTLSIPITRFCIQTVTNCSKTFLLANILISRNAKTNSKFGIAKLNKNV